MTHPPEIKHMELETIFLKPSFFYPASSCNIVYFCFIIFLGCNERCNIITASDSQSIRLKTSFLALFLRFRMGGKQTSLNQSQVQLCSGWQGTC